MTGRDHALHQRRHRGRHRELFRQQGARGAQAIGVGRQGRPQSLTQHRAAITPEVSREFGEYVVHSCAGCHGAGYSGGKIPGMPPSFPQAGNITPDEATGIGGWSEADFIRALREGVRPDGTKLDPFMPVQLTKHMTDTELKAAYLYLRSVPAKPKGSR